MVHEVGCGLLQKKVYTRPVGGVRTCHAHFVFLEILITMIETKLIGGERNEKYDKDKFCLMEKK